MLSKFILSFLYKKGLKVLKMVPQGRIELPTQGFSVLCSTDWATEAYKWRSGRDSNSRPPTWQAGILTNWTTGPLTFFIWLRGKDLNQRPPGYEPDELPDCSIPRYMAEKEGFEPPRDLHPLSVFKTEPFSHLGISPFIILKCFGGPDRTRTCDQPVMSR